MTNNRLPLRRLTMAAAGALLALMTMLTPATAVAQEDLVEVPSIGLLPGVGTLLGQLGLTHLIPTPGTVSFEGYIVHGGFARRYLAIRPEVAVPGAPVLVLLHPRDETPEQMANIAAAGRLAAEEGAWVLLPEGSGRTWSDRHYLEFVDDVGFLTALLDQVIPQHRLDASRVYFAGFSNGGYMAERFACDRAERVAGIATVGAPLRDSVGERCALTRPMSVIQFHGTEDVVVPYPTLLLRSGAIDGARYWAGRAGCAIDAPIDSVLPNRESVDITRVRLRQYGGCTAGTDVRLYTIDGGGHNWPGSPHPLYLALLGRTSGDVDATLTLWRALIPHAR